MANPDALVGLAAEQAKVAAVTEGLSTGDLVSLDRKISRLEKSASTALAEALSQGIDMAVAASAVRALQAELGEARRRRDQLAAWAASAATSAGRARKRSGTSRVIRPTLLLFDRSGNLTGVSSTPRHHRRHHRVDGLRLVRRLWPSDRSRPRPRLRQVYGSWLLLRPEDRWSRAAYRRC